MTERDAIDVIGVVQRETAYGIVKAVVEKDARAGLGLIADTLEEGHDAYQMYKGLVSYLRDLLMIKVWNDKPPFVFMDNEEFGKANELLKTVEYRQVQEMLRLMLEAEDLVRGAFPKTSLEVLFINLYGLAKGEYAGKPHTGGDKEISAAPMQAAGRPASKGQLEVAEPARPQLPEARPSAPVRQAPIDSRLDDPEDEDDWMPVGDLPIGRTSPPPAAQPRPDGPSRAGDFPAYLKEQSTMLFGMLGAFKARAEDNNLVIALGRQSGQIKGDAAIANELKKLASDFYKMDMTIRFVDDVEKKEDTIDDYVKEAELLFRA